jgi:phytoene dehydrogenase-like protein
MYFMAKAVRPILGMVPPDPTSLDPRDLKDLADLASHFLDLGDEHFPTFIKLMTMSSADFLDEWFETEPLKATMSASGIIGTFMGPRSPGTAYVLLHHYMGEIDGVFRAWGYAKGGTGRLAEALASSARSFGAEIRTDSPAEAVILRGNKAAGVALQDGTEFSARKVVSSLDPRRTFLELVTPDLLPNELVDDVNRFRFQGSSGKVNLALDSAPDLPSMPGEGPHLRGSISISPSIDYLERAYDQAKYGEFSHQPYIDIVIPSMIDPDMAPPGKHVMSCFVQYAPYELTEGDWDGRREEFGDAVIDTLSEYIPNLKDIMLHRQVLTPLDIERITGLSEGNIFQGELDLSQLFFLRPAAGYSKYRTPIRGYYQCGSGTHPGGGITGAPGRLAALEILGDMGY